MSTNLDAWLTEHDRQMADRIVNGLGCFAVVMRDDNGYLVHAVPWANVLDAIKMARADSSTTHQAMPGVSVSAKQVEEVARATLALGVNPWSPQFRRDLHAFLAALGVTVTDGDA